MHVQCSVCLHHKMLIRELSPHLNARTRQSELYSEPEHLVAQYGDRQKYWQARGISRLQFETYLVVMIDGMDQCNTQDRLFAEQRTWRPFRDPGSRDRGLGPWVWPFLRCIGARPPKRCKRKCGALGLPNLPVA